MYSVYKECPEGKFWEIWNAGKAIYHMFLGLFFIFLFLISFPYFFFCYSLKFSGYSLYFNPSLFSNQ